MKLILFLTVLLLLGLNSCYYEAVPVRTLDGCDRWRMEENARIKRAGELAYQQDAEKARREALKPKTTSKADSLSGARANSVVGTSADPFGVIRNAPIGNPLLPTTNVNVRVW